MGDYEKASWDNKKHWWKLAENLAGALVSMIYLRKYRELYSGNFPSINKGRTTL